MEKRLQEQYVTLLQQRNETEEKIENLRNEIYEFFLKSCPAFTLPYDAELNWSRDIQDVVSLHWDGGISVAEDVHSGPCILSGLDDQQHKAGSKFRIVSSWKTNKKTKGTHYFLAKMCSTASKAIYTEIAHFYG